MHAVVRKHPCDFEASDLRLCGWQENADRLGPEREEGLTAASAAPHGDIAPPVDANPGTSEGIIKYTGCTAYLPLHCRATARSYGDLSLEVFQTLLYCTCMHACMQ